MNETVACDRIAQHNAACSLSGVTLNQIDDVAVKTSLESVKTLGNRLGQRYRLVADNPDLVSFRRAMHRAQDLDLSMLKRRGRKAVKTLLAKASELDAHFAK